MTPLRLTGVPRTMLMTTRARVEEQVQPHALLKDPKIVEWWPSLAWDPVLDPLYSPISQLIWACRARVFDDLAQKHLQQYPQAVVVELGSGLSTRYYRIGQGCRCWFELDLPAITQIRCQLDTETQNHRFWERSALDFSWMQELPEGSSAAVLIIAEGLLMYFKEAEVKALVDELRQQLPEATLIFDTIGDLIKVAGAGVLAKIGAPLQWFLADERALSTVGLSCVEVRSLVQEFYRDPQRLGLWSGTAWVGGIPLFRNATLILETRLFSGGVC